MIPEEQVRLARHGDTEARAALAARPNTAPELLTFLAADALPRVRASVAANAATPPQAARLLAEDADATVRAALARRMGAEVPRPGGAPDRLARFTAATLSLLVQDAAVEVRAALAEALAELPDAPRDLVLRLARDMAQAVAIPVIRLSPLLTEAELLELVRQPPAPCTRAAVAGRPRLTEAVADAIAGTGDRGAVAALLRNPSAAIREATLDAIATASGGEPAWQAALVRRPHLPPHVARVLGTLVADHLIGQLMARSDLPPGLAETLHERLRNRLLGPIAAEASLRGTVEAGDSNRLREALAEAAGLSPRQIEATLALRSPRALLALCWKAGLSAELAVRVQIVLGGISPGQILRPNVEGDYPLTQAELVWQLELLDGLPL